MHARCPRCGLLFEREHGYFAGAMVVSYAIATAVYGGLVVLLWTLLPLEWALLAAALLFLVTVPAIWRYSRVIWMHIDRALDPDDAV
ncbi:MAG: DUF983 domain-containing protein [Chloroflexi bacterium]|nr:DUF983 domain-containing protein [Chloroflexota bacterium]